MAGENHNNFGGEPYSMSVNNKGFADQAREYLERIGIKPKKVNGRREYPVGKGEVVVSKDGTVTMFDVGFRAFDDLYKIRRALE